MGEFGGSRARRPAGSAVKGRDSGGVAMRLPKSSEVDTYTGVAGGTLRPVNLRPTV